MDYKQMYFALFNAVTDAIETLQQAQQEGEESYISDQAPGLTVLKPPPAPSRQERKD